MVSWQKYIRPMYMYDACAHPAYPSCCTTLHGDGEENKSAGTMSSLSIVPVHCTVREA